MDILRNAAARFRESLGHPITWMWVGIAVLHASLTAWLMEIRLDHLMFYFIGLAPVLWGGRLRQVTTLAIPLILVGTSYEFSRFLMFLQDNFHIQDLYDAEKLLFGINTADHGRLILSEYFKIHNWPALDLVCGLFYGYYLVHCIGLGVIFTVIDPARQQRMAWSWCFANWIGIATYLAWPAAPPWYVDMYGFEYVKTAVPNAAGTLRFDELLGINYFRDMYANTNTVFGALPSLHVGGPLAMAYASIGADRRFVAYMFAVPVGIGFSSFYLQHHYVLDLIAGAVVAGLGFAIASFLQARIDWTAIGRRIGFEPRPLLKRFQ